MEKADWSFSFAIFVLLGGISFHVIIIGRSTGEIHRSSYIRRETSILISMVLAVWKNPMVNYEQLIVYLFDFFLWPLNSDGFFPNIISFCNEGEKSRDRKSDVKKHNRNNQINRKTNRK